MTNDDLVSYLHKYFPSICKEKRSLLRYDEIGLYSISPPKNAYIITSYIMRYFKGNNVIVTDAMAGLGGNTLSFANYLYRVNAIECDEERFKHLVSNIGLYSSANVVCLNANYLSIMYKIQQHVIFLDPPWGGKNYKDSDNMIIEINNISLSTICNDIYDNKLCMLLLLKLPLNYNIASFSDKIKNNMHVEKLQKILIISVYIT